MSDQSGDARYAPPQAQVADIRPDLRLSGHLATRGRRFLATMVDGLLAGAILGLLAWLTPWNIWANAKNDTLWTLKIGEMALGFALFVVMQGYLVVTRSQTIGKLLFKTRIVRCDGTHASAIRIIGLRYGVTYLASIVSIAAMIFGLLDGLFIFRKSRRTLHDLIADTTVVNV